MAFSVNSSLLSCEAFAAIVTFEQLRSCATYEVNPSWRESILKKFQKTFKVGFVSIHVSSNSLAKTLLTKLR